ncbi:MAG: AMP-binding protein, partial [Alphaproteobacteria bacterium]
MIPHENEKFPVPPEVAQAAHCDDATYKEMYARSIDDPDGFWAEQAESLEWIQRWTKVKDSKFGMDAYVRWFEGGKINVSANCIDRHLATRGDQTAIIWEGDDPNDSKLVTYRELHREVCRMANVLKSQGVTKGDRVTIYMPMIPEAAYAMLACTRIGAVHSVVFGGFSPDSLADRIHDCDSNCVITADEGLRGGRPIPLKANTDKALERSPSVKSVIVVKRTGGAIDWIDGRDVWLHEAAAKVPDDCPAEEMNAEDPLFILYTSGSTGKPKGVLHSTAGYLLFASL